MANPEDVEKEDGKAFEVLSVEIAQCKVFYIEPTFSFQKESPAKISPTGQLIAFRIISTKSNKPQFLGRWDQNQDLIDIDVENVPESDRMAFRRDDKGYGPHQGKKIDPKERLIQFNFSFKEEKIFTATIRIGVLKKIGFSDNVSLEEYTDARTD